MGAEAVGLNASRAILWRPSSTKKGPGQVCCPSLYWVPRSYCPVGEGVVAYSTDDKPQFTYEAFNEGRDFGPLDLSRTVMYCRWVEALCAAHMHCTALVHVVSDSATERANTVALCGAYLVLAHGFSAEDAFRPWANETLPQFVDCRGEASPGTEINEEEDAEFRLSVLDVLRGLEKARDLRWCDWRTFDVEDHTSMLRPEHGDMSWLLPGKALALASPWAEPQDQDGLPVCTPEILTPYFLHHGLLLVVQCNNPDREEEGERRRLLCYEPQNFVDRGIRHLHLPFEDGGCPSVELVLQFLEDVEAYGGSFAVHCRSGLGRTATLIGVYSIRHLGFQARTFIGWVRCMRPGTVHGSQQQYLVNLEQHIRPGATRPLTSLDPRERLMLLPRRELRFWALDSGIPASHTRSMREPELVETILMARGIHVPKPQLPPMPLRGPPTPGAGATNSAVKTVLPRPTAASPSSQLSSKGPAGNVTTGSNVGSGLNSLSAAIASLNRSLTNSSASPSSGGPSTAQAAEADNSAAATDEWAEVLRYLHLLTALQTAAADGEDSWESVRQTVLRLRDESQAPSSGGDSAPQPTANSVCEEKATEVLAARAAVDKEAQSRFAERRELLEKVQQVQQENDELRQRQIKDKEDRAAERKKMDDRGEALLSELQRDEARLKNAVREVEELRGSVLRQGGLEKWQVERVERLRQEIASARETTSQHGNDSRELRQKLDYIRRRRQRPQEANPALSFISMASKASA
mmetsp:Transcript_143696/g.253776  ORF Transcript_143696/g.253776 Transcript_143696/m.253776 type:complete len:750 (-) Transcript_143696:143-2392(-)